MWNFICRNFVLRKGRTRHFCQLTLTKVLLMDKSFSCGKIGSVSCKIPRGTCWRKRYDASMWNAPRIAGPKTRYLEAAPTPSPLVWRVDNPWCQGTRNRHYCWCRCLVCRRNAESWRTQLKDIGGKHASSEAHHETQVTQRLAVNMTCEDKHISHWTSYI